MTSMVSPSIIPTTWPEKSSADAREHTDRISREKNKDVMKVFRTAPSRRVDQCRIPFIG
jgi:hypothetical protein